MKSAEWLWNAWKPRNLVGPLLGVAFFATLICGACGGVPKTSYYTLRTPAPPSPNDARTDFVLGVEHFRAPQMLRDDRIAYFVSPTEMNYYQYHRWSADPASMFSDYTAQWLSDLGVFAQVRMLPTRETIDFRLSGRVLDFQEVDYQGGVKARVSLELTLIRTRDRKVVWTGKQEAETPVQEKGVAAVAIAINAACKRLVQELVPGLTAEVEREYGANQGQTP